MAISVFITRKLAKDSVFRQRLEAERLEIYGQSMIRFSGISFKKLPAVHWIFFYSGNGVKYFFKGLKKAQIQLPWDLKWAVMGQGTAKALQSKKIHADFVGSGTPEETAAAFLKLAKGQKVLFPRAKNSRQSVQRILENDIDLIDLVVYSNQPKQLFELPDYDFVVFTSPMNVSAYLQNKKIKSGQRIISIGKSTAAALKEHGMEGFTTAEQSSEIALAEAILKQLNSG